MAQQLRNRVLHMSPEYMKEVCEQIAEIKRVVTDTKKQLTKEERQAVKTYRHSMLERIQAVDEMYTEIETGIHNPRLKFTCDVFEKWEQIAKSVPSTHEFK
jgi:sialic acid synthase SpsE